jgi:hypothetical protein
LDKIKKGKYFTDIREIKQQIIFKSITREDYEIEYPEASQFLTKEHKISRMKNIEYF